MLFLQTVCLSFNQVRLNSYITRIFLERPSKRLNKGIIAGTFHLIWPPTFSFYRSVFPRSIYLSLVSANFYQFIGHTGGLIEDVAYSMHFLFSADHRMSCRKKTFWRSNLKLIIDCIFKVALENGFKGSPLIFTKSIGVKFPVNRIFGQIEHFYRFHRIYQSKDLFDLSDFMSDSFRSFHFVWWAFA